MSKFCPNCGSPIDENARFCGSCGSPCAAEPAAPAEPAESVPYAKAVQPEQPAESVPYTAAVQPEQPAQQYSYSQPAQSAQTQPAQQYPAYTSYGAQNNQQQYARYPQNGYQPVQPQKKSHKGCIIAAIIVAVVIIGIIVAAVVGFKLFSAEIKTELENSGVTQDSDMKVVTEAGNSSPEASVSTFLKLTQDLANGSGDLEKYIDCFYEYKFIDEEYKDIMTENFESIGEYFAEAFETDAGSVTFSYKMIDIEDYDEEDIADYLEYSEAEIICDVEGIEAMCECELIVHAEGSTEFEDEDWSLICIKRDGEWYISALSMS